MVVLTHEFYLSSTITAIRNCGTNRAGFVLAREAIFIRLLAYSTSGICFESLKHFVSVTNANEQAKLVWDYCIDAGILQKTESGYSALDWIRSHGMTGKTFKPDIASNLPSGARKRGRPSKDTSNPINPPKVGQISQINGIVETDVEPEFEIVPKETETPKDTSPSQTDSQDVDAPKDQELIVFNTHVENKPADVIKPAAEVKPIDELKECVRPNVFLSRSEILDLKSRFTDDQVTLMLDKLSEYKATTGRYYRSDFDAIERWVVRWMNDQQKQQAQPPQPKDAIIEYPSWLTGK